jgi:CBS domain-containing protein
MKVEKLLAMKGRKVVTVLPTATVASAAKTLGENRFGVLVVSTDGETISGIISERDIVRELGVSGGDLLTKPVSSIMTSAVRTCREDDNVERLMEIMTEHRIRHLPVSEGGKLVGLISIGDIVKVRVRQLEHEADQLERYISNTW